MEEQDGFAVAEEVPEDETSSRAGSFGALFFVAVLMTLLVVDYIRVWSKTTSLSLLYMFLLAAIWALTAGYGIWVLQQPRKKLK